MSQAISRVNYNTRKIAERMSSCKIESPGGGGRKKVETETSLVSFAKIMVKHYIAFVSFLSLLLLID